MKRSPSLKVWLSSLIIAVIYILLTVFLTNARLVISTVTGSFPIGYKLALSLSLVEGLSSTMTHLAFTLLMVIAVLTGLNISLLFIRFKRLNSGHGKLKLVVGGSSLLGIVSSGCAACGLPVLGLVGISGSLIYWPLQGMELSYLSIILLALSLYFLLKGNTRLIACEPEV